MRADPRQELQVALAGPAVNVILAAALYLCGRALGSDVTHGLSMWEGSVLARLFWLNVSLAAFDLLPPLPGMADACFAACSRCGWIG
jgi:stage IV sporulation protein FB